MSDATTKLVALPAYLPRRLQAFRIVRDGTTSYILRDKLADKTYDVAQWQFFVLEVLPGCETADKLLAVFSDRFARTITEREVLTFFAELADNKLLDEESAKHPLLAPFTKTGYALEQGLIKPKSFDELAAKLAMQAPGKPGSAPPPAPAAATPAMPGPDVVLPAGVNESDDLDPRQSKLLLKFFKLAPFTRRVLPFIDPLKYIVYILPLLVLSALMILIHNSDLVFTDLDALRSSTNLLVHAAFSLLAINLLVQLTFAFIAQKFRASVGLIGIALRFGFFPRFLVEIGHAEQLTRRERMWLQGGPLLMRFFLFSLGALVWYNARDSSPALAHAGLGMAFLCSVNLLVEGGNPLVKGNSYHLLAAFMDEPYLRGKSYKAFMDILRGGVTTEPNRAVLGTYALASFIYAYLVVLMIVGVVGHFLLIEVHVGGAGMIITVGLALYLSVRTVSRFKKISDAYDRSQQFDRWRMRALPAESGETVQVEPQGSRTWNYLLKALPLMLLLLLFLPYPYEPGGSFEIYPAARQVLTTDISGLIEEVNYDGGERLKKGTVIARINATDLMTQIAVVDAQISEQKSVISDLKAKPKPEEVVVAQRDLETAQDKSRFSAARVPRYERLYGDHVISFEELDNARRESVVNLREVAQREAQLALVKTGVPKDKIQAEEAKLVALTEQRNELVGKVDRTPLKMPFDGNILTLHLKQRLNSVLDRGAIFATVESTGTVTAEVEVPESDVAYIRVGATLRARPNAFYEREFKGIVKTIDPNVTSKSFGRVVKVLADIDNPNGELRTGMTGFAKMNGGSIPVWKAFTVALIHFFQVQVWSWLP